MAVKKTIMVLNAEDVMVNTGDYHVAKYENVIDTIATNEFDKMPFKRIKMPLHNETGSLFEIYNDAWTKIAGYTEHSFEYAVILGIKDLKMLVYGNKIGEKIIDDNLTINNNPTYPTIYHFNRGDKLLLEVDKRIRIVHNITLAAAKYNMLQNGPRVR